ncbi:MAG: methionine gamma-lyase family protein [Oscillospiraceae bacterium]|jgi:cystathionine beta-lyase family protein involved in aluminum resistance|nr:methionine gamma-lyase family protein [Oscillospiraceae bacterium]
MTDTSKTGALAERAERDCAERFAEIDATALENTRRVLDAFRRHRVSETHFAGTTGYGYGDRGRETLDRVFADIFGAEEALVRTGFANGTHAITAALFGALKPGDKLLSATGAPYDTLQTAIGITGNARGSLAEWGVDYRETPLLPGGLPDLAAIAEAAGSPRVRAVLVQRSRGYGDRPALSVEQTGAIADAVHSANPNIAVVVDNCYGEFCDASEPCAAGADIAAGSLIKNPGGGLAPAGGYVAGRADLVDGAASRLTSPGIGGEAGATLGQNRLLFQGLFTAPHVTAQALKTAVFAARLFELLGFSASPRYDEPRHDIIQTLKLGSAERLRAFCAGVQSASPVDSFVTPEPWAMPGYSCDVIMAAGAFVSGASIELSADAPLREPYTVFLQGGLTYEAGKLGIIEAATQLTSGS